MKRIKDLTQDDLPYIDAVEKYIDGKDISQLEFSKIIGVSDATVSRWLGKKEAPSRKNKKAIEFITEFNFQKKNLKFDCLGICQGLNDFEKDTLSKYSKLPFKIRKKVFRQWEEVLDTAQNGNADRLPIEASA